MQELNWNDVRVFLAVADAGQLGHAAQKLKLDPTTLGRRLKRLEQRLGVTLFERTRSGQVLTEAGEALLTKAEGMAELARMIDEVAVSHSGISGTLRLSVSEGFGSQFLTPYLNSFAQQHPALTIELVANSGFLSPSRREADIAVMLSRSKAGPVLCKKLSDYRLRLYASRSYLEQHGTPETPADLEHGHTLVSYVPDLLYAPELNYLDDFHAGLESQIRSSSINAQHRLVEAGAGIGVLPCFIADKSTNLVVVCPEKIVERSFWIITHRDTQGLSKVRAGKEWLAECVTQGRKRLMP
ncbi:LysR family transcriptional regulator [Croceicoccus sp. F390]|uniref:LysR family transcriptional regulator n=1 Tax=Croceicoccus esteveae TaxID=3075597 RepID=A0ABU2ZI10_9SPHN|nr:LysR family transcriptional regulator [Croceicoccus sp. F390]MDT0576248.1 LysR family transcriptional regulator [Croceicoccus sp. F390]